MNIYKMKVDQEKCGGCNWKVDELYLYASDKKDAIKRFKAGDEACCDECMREDVNKAIEVKEDK